MKNSFILAFALSIGLLFTQKALAQVTLYDNTNFQGQSITLKVGSYKLSTLNNKASSIKVQPGYTATVYDKSSASGINWSFSNDCFNLFDMCSKADAPYTFNNNISFVVVKRNGTNWAVPPKLSPSSKTIIRDHRTKK